MTRGIPQNPVDGVQYSGLFLGVPMVLEYDSATGGFKLIVDAEIGEAIQISGSVSIEAADLASLAGAQYAEDSPHTSGNTGTYVLSVRQDAPAALAGAGDYSSFLTDALGRLHTFVSGSYTNVLELAAPAALVDGTSAGTTMSQIGAFNMVFDETNGDWQRMRGMAAFGDGLQSADLNPGAIPAGAFLYAWSEANSRFDRLRQEGVTGSFALRTSLYAQQTAPGDSALRVGALADGYTNPSLALEVGAFLMGYNGATWDRLYMGVSGSLGVDLVTQLDAVNDEITAYITGTTTVELATGTVVGIGGQTKVIERAVVNISGSGGEFELVAAIAAQRIKVLSMMLIADDDTNVHFQSGWTGTAVTGPMSLPADGDGFFLNTPSTPDEFHFQTLTGQNLVLDQSAAAAIGGWIQWYSEV